MTSIIIGFFTLILLIVCVLLVLVILMQRPNANSGMGASLGGGAAEGVFGGETGNVLTKATVKLSILFFIISAGLYLGYLYAASSAVDTAPKALSLSSVGTSAPAAPAKAPAAVPVAPAKK